MNRQLPEMLCRWMVFESLYAEIINPIKSLQRDNMCISPEVWEESMRRIDQAVAATTCTGSHIENTSNESMDLIWDRFNAIAERMFTGDTRVQNG